MLGDYLETWRVCNQFGGGEASHLAKLPTNSHLKFVPIAGVAALLSVRGDETLSTVVIRSGSAYCFLPLPIQTDLPIMVNGFFELSSNRRDLWQGSHDMTGDGQTRAMWNDALLRDIIAPCYLRLLLFVKDMVVKSSQHFNNYSNVAYRNENNSAFDNAMSRYQRLWPSIRVNRPWLTMVQSFYRVVQQEPVLAYRRYRNLHDNSVQNSNATSYEQFLSTLSYQIGWIPPKAAVLLPNDHPLLFQSENESVGNSASVLNQQHREELITILELLNVPIARYVTYALEGSLISTQSYSNLATPALMRTILKSLGRTHNIAPATKGNTTTTMKSSNLQSSELPPTSIKHFMCKFLLHYLLSDLTSIQKSSDYMKLIYEEFSNLPIIPLQNQQVGHLRIFTTAQIQMIDQLESMGYSYQDSLSACILSSFDLMVAVEVLSNPTNTTASANPIASLQKQFTSRKQRLSTDFYMISNDSALVLEGKQEISMDLRQRKTTIFGEKADVLFVDTSQLYVEDLELLYSNKQNEQNSHQQSPFIKYSNLKAFQARYLKDILRCILPDKCLQKSVVSAEELSTNSSATAAKLSTRPDEVLFLQQFHSRFWNFAFNKPDFIQSTAIASYAFISCNEGTTFYSLEKTSNILCLPRNVTASTSTEYLNDPMLQEVCRNILQIPILDMFDFEYKNAASVLWEYVRPPTPSGILLAISYKQRQLCQSQHTTSDSFISSATHLHRKALRKLCADYINSGKDKITGN
jgi:hypothetical protein